MKTNYLNGHEPDLTKTVINNMIDNYMDIPQDIPKVLPQDLQGLIDGLENTGATPISTLIDLFHNHVQNKKKQMNSDNILKVKWKFTKLGPNLWKFERFELDGSGVGLEPNKEMLSKFYNVPSYVHNNDGLGVHGVGETTGYIFLRGPQNGSFFISTITDSTKEYHCFENNIKDPDSFKHLGSGTKEEIKNKFDVPTDLIGDSGLYSRYTIDGTNIPGWNDDDFFSILGSEIGSRFSKPLEKGHLEVNIEVVGTSGRIIYEEDIKPYHWLQEKGTYDTTYWNPKGFDRMGVEYFKVVDQDSEEYERGLKKYKNRIIGLNIDNVSKNSKVRNYGYGDHVQVIIVEEGSGVILDYFNMGTRCNYPYGRVIITVPIENTSSRLDKTNIGLKDKDGNSHTLDELKDRLKSFFKKNLGWENKGQNEVLEQNQLYNIITGKIKPVEWIGGVVQWYYRQLFDVVDCPDYDGTGNTIKQIFKKEFEYCRKNITGKKTLTDGGELDLYNIEVGTIIEMIDGKPDEKHYNKNMRYILMNTDDKGNRLTTKIKTLCKSKKTNPQNKCDFDKKWIDMYVTTPQSCPGTKDIEHELIDLCYLGIPKLLKTESLD